MSAEVSTADYFTDQFHYKDRLTSFTCSFCVINPNIDYIYSQENTGNRELQQIITYELSIN